MKRLFALVVVLSLIASTIPAFAGGDSKMKMPTMIEELVDGIKGGKVTIADKHKMKPVKKVTFFQDIANVFKKSSKDKSLRSK